MRRARCLALAAVMLLAGALPGLAEPLRLLVDTAYQPHHVPILTAALRGHFQREGIELLLEPGLGPNRTAVLVGQRAFDMGHVSAPAAAAAIAAGTPIRMVAIYQPRTTLAVVGIQGRVRLAAPRAVEGLRVGITPGTIDTTALTLFRRANNIGLGAMTVLPTDRGAKLQDLLGGRLDVAIGDGVVMRAALREQGLEAELLELSELGVKLMGFGFVASQTLLTANPGLVKRALAAVRAGFAETAADPAGACAAARARFRLSATDEACTATLGIFLGTVMPPGAPGWGRQQVEGWQAMLEAMRASGDLQGTRPTSFYFTNNVVP
jgi:NitT/TauT family transport system substrate-binding protein